MKPRNDDQSTSIATQSYCYLSIPRVFPHELRALPEMAAKRKGMANPPHRASMFIVVLQQLFFRHHGIDASAFLRLDWIVDEHSENVSLPERTWRDLYNQI